MLNNDKFNHKNNNNSEQQHQPKQAVQCTNIKNRSLFINWENYVVNITYTGQRERERERSEHMLQNKCTYPHSSNQFRSYANQSCIVLIFKRLAINIFLLHLTVRFSLKLCFSVCVLCVCALGLAYNAYIRVQYVLCIAHDFDASKANKLSIE